MKHLGDITKIDTSTIEIPDVITGGSPCQDLSIAGKRAGLDGQRSGLFMEQIRITKELRERDRATNRRAGQYVRPRFMVWENVPGAFSSGSPKGADFQAVLTEIIKIAEPEAPDVPMPQTGWPRSGLLFDGMGRWSVAWRLHDAQFWGVPQRRKRIALVADFGGLAAGEVCFERRGLRGDPAEGGEERENAPGAATAGAGGAEQNDQYGIVMSVAENITATLGTGKHKNEPAVFCLQGNGIGRRDNAGCARRGWRKDQCYTLNTVDRPAIFVYENHSQDCRYNQFGNICETISAKYGTGGNNQPLVIESQQNTEQGWRNKSGVAVIVRCLTPLECERLQGFPDGWTDIGEWTDSKGKKHQTSDAARYRALGNSIAVGYANRASGFWCWLLKRISAQYERNATLGSLFDGIGGFPLAWEHYNGRGSALWASEIEEFCIAVTKKRFPEAGHE